MKKVIIVIAVLGISAFNLFNYSNAQITQNHARRMFRFSAELASAADNETATPAVYGNDINAKAIRTFQKMFKDAQNVSWSEENGTYNSRFKSNGVDYRNFFSKGGSWIGGMQTYGENKLPRDVRAIIKPIYYDYTITIVDEVNLPNQQPIYVIHMEGENLIKNIAVQGGEIRTIDEFEKAN
jgi:hypothetical protein